MRGGVELQGRVIDCLRGGKFVVEVQEGAATFSATCTIGGRMKTKAPGLRVLLGDTVRVLLSETDLSCGRIEWVIRK
jgi:translation initiation factor IF-1